MNSVSNIIGIGLDSKEELSSTSSPLCWDMGEEIRGKKLATLLV